MDESDKDAIINIVLEGCAAHLESVAAEMEGERRDGMRPGVDLVCEVLRLEAQTIRESRTKILEARVVESDESQQFTLTNSQMVGKAQGDRRFKVLPMSPELLFSLVFNCLAGRDQEMFHRISALVIEGIPEDVRIEGVAYDPKYGMMLLRLYSSIWPVVETNDIPILKWNVDVKVITKNMLLQPYTSIDLLEMMNEARSRIGLDHLSFNWSDRPIWLRDVLLLDGDTPKDGMVLNMPVLGSESEQVAGEVFTKEKGNG